MSAPLAGWLALTVSPLGALLAFAVGALLAFLSADTLTQTIVTPLCDLLSQNGQGGCALLFNSPQEAFSLRVRQAGLAGLILAIPALMYQVARFLAPTLQREMPRAVIPFAIAGLALAVAGASYAILIEAPQAFGAALQALSNMEDALPLAGTTVDYARAAIAMAMVYVLILQLPVLGLMMIKSLRLRRALQAERAA